MDLGYNNENQDSGMMKEALKSGKEALKKKQKDEVKKAIWTSLKGVIIPFLIVLAKVLAITILCIIVVASITNFINELTDNSNSDDDMSSVSDNTGSGEYDITVNNLILTQDQIKNFINSYDTTNTNLKQELLNNITLIENWQNKHNYSAALLITIIFEEANGTNNFDLNNFLNEIDTKADEWNENGYTTVQEIAKDYLGTDDESTTEWANNIIQKINQALKDSGIVTYGELDRIGDGYNSVYTNKAGRTFINYKQCSLSGISCSYENALFWGSDTIHTSGCCLTSVSIIISGHTNVDRNPKIIMQEDLGGTSTAYSNNNGFNPTNVLNKFGVTCTRPYIHNTSELNSNIKDQIITYLKNGREIIIHVVPPSTFTSSEHWIALLDYNASSNEIYISNPSRKKWNRDQRLDRFNKNINRMYRIYIDN